MKKFTLGFIVGVAVAALVLVPLLLTESRNKYEFGRNNGIISARVEVADALGKEFGQYDGHSPYKVLFSIKTTDVISVETNGIKTVRIIP
ncbi:MAG: hypothetical protein WCO45_06085 [Pseudanabaena sp. ELA607]